MFWFQKIGMIYSVMGMDHLFRLEEGAPSDIPA